MPEINAAKIARSSLWLTAGFVLAKASQLVAQVVLARLLSPEDFGIWAMVLIVTVLADLFKDKAISQVLVQRGLEDTTRVDAVYSLGVTIAIAMFVVQTLIGLPLSYLFNRPILFPLVAIVGLKFLIGMGAGSHDAIMQRQMRFREIAICDALGGIARLLGGVISASLGAGIWAFAIAELSFALVDGISKRTLSGHRFTYHLIPDAEAVKNVRGYIGSLVGINLAVYFNTNGDNVVVGKLLGATSLGYYSLAYQLAMLPTFALAQFNRVNLSVLSQRDNTGKQTLVFKSLELYALIYAPMYGVGILVAPWLIPVVYGQAWLPCVPIFQFIVVYSYARGFMQTLGTTLNALDKPNINAAINWALVPLSLSGFWLGSSLGGVNGVAIAAALVMGVGATIWFQVVTCRITGWSLLALVKTTALPTLATIVGLAIALLIPPISLWQPVLQPLCLLTVYVAIVTIGSAGRLPQLLTTMTKQVLK